MSIGREDLLEDIVKIGVRPGDCLALGVSLRSIGWIEGGPDALIDALLDAVGEDGTIFIPSFTRAFNLPLSRRKRLRVFGSGGGEVAPWNYIYDPGKTPPETGAVPVAMWRRDDSIRSRHPTNSVIAMGRLAEFITRDHDAIALKFLPYYRLLEVQGRGLFMGLQGRLVGLRHLSQLEAGLVDILPPTLGVRYLGEDGSLGIYRRSKSGCTIRLPELNKEMIEEDLILEGRVGNADSMLVDAAGAVERMARSLKDDPRVNLCRRYHCLWCRELERKYNLFDGIDNPAFFQKSGIMRHATFRLNDMRMRNSYLAECLSKLLSVMISISEGCHPGLDVYTYSSRSNP